MAKMSDHRVAIITGAGSGIGRGIATELAGAGIRCVLTGRRLKPLQESADMISGDRDRLLIIQSDVTLAADRARIVSESLEKFGHIDILVNNAGISRKAPLLDYGEEEWRQVMNTNLDSCFFLAKAVIPHMRDNGWGRIINIASVYSTLVLNNDLYSEMLPTENEEGRGPTRQPAYHASKGGLLTLTRELSAALAPWGITVNAISPGMIMTEQSKDVVNDSVIRKLKAMTPVGRLGEPWEIGYAVLFLASEKTSFITGIELRVDGGWSIW